MTIQDLLWKAATLMGTGMLVVFLFLTILIFAVKLLAVIGSKVSIEDTNEQPSRVARTPAKQIPQAVVAAITAAIHQHRNQAK